VELARLIILLSIPVLLFLRPKFIRDYLGDTAPIVLGFIALVAMALQFFLFQWRGDDMKYILALAVCFCVFHFMWSLAVSWAGNMEAAQFQC